MSENIFDNLEVGGNVFELIEFSLDRYLQNGSKTTGRYGVNVAKVREVVRMPKINPLASGINGIAGVFELRGIPIPAINLAVALGDREAPISDNQQIIVTEFSLKRAGFIVKTTERIRRIAWEKVIPPTADKQTCINGMTLVENNEFLFILDLERILLDIEGRSNNLLGGYQRQDRTNEPKMEASTQKQEGFQHAKQEEILATILLIDDSDIILNNAKTLLERAGYKVLTASNGIQGKKILEEYAEGKSSTGKIDVIVTDVEMPKMDGLTLTKWVKEHGSLSIIPVILHTSLSGKANLESGRLVGANAYVIKNDINMLLGLLKDFRKGLSFKE